jgi:hypothetical protein
MTITYNKTKLEIGDVVSINNMGWVVSDISYEARAHCAEHDIYASVWHYVAKNELGVVHFNSWELDRNSCHYNPNITIVRNALPASDYSSEILIYVKVLTDFINTKYNMYTSGHKEMMGYIKELSEKISKML